MKIKFLIDYIGRETAMKEFRAGDEVDFPVSHALELINLDIAEEVGLIDDAPMKRRSKKQVSDD